MPARLSLAGVLAAIVLGGLCLGSGPAAAGQTAVRCDWRGCTRVDCNYDSDRCQDYSDQDRRADARTSRSDDWNYAQSYDQSYSRSCDQGCEQGYSQTYSRSYNPSYGRGPAYRGSYGYYEGGPGYGGGYESRPTYSSRDSYVREQYGQRAGGQTQERVRHFDRYGWHYDCNYEVTRCLIQREDVRRR